jgi:hypothetical protein
MDQAPQIAHITVTNPAKNHSTQPMTVNTPVATDGRIGCRKIRGIPMNPKKMEVETKEL